MRKIKEILELYPKKRIWIEVSTPRLKRQFAREIRKMGLKMLNGKPFKARKCGNIMAIGGGKGIAYVSGLVYGYSKQAPFNENFNNVIRVDYGKYRNGNENFIIK